MLKCPWAKHWNHMLCFFFTSKRGYRLPSNWSQICQLRMESIYFHGHVVVKTLKLFLLFFVSVVKQSIRQLMEVDWGEPAHSREGRASDTPPAHTHWAKVSLICTHRTDNSPSFVIHLPTSVMWTLCCKSQYFRKLNYINCTKQEVVSPSKRFSLKISEMRR